MRRRVSFVLSVVVSLAFASPATGSTAAQSTTTPPTRTTSSGLSRTVSTKTNAKTRPVCDLVMLGVNTIPDWDRVARLFGGMPMVLATNDPRLGGRASNNPKRNVVVYFVIRDRPLADPKALRQHGFPSLRTARIRCEELRLHSSWVGAA